MRKKIGFLASALLMASAAQAYVVEDFESGGWGPDWVGTGGTAVASGAHDGTYAGRANGNWYYRTDNDVYLGPNSIIRLWFQSVPGDTIISVAGIKIGFGADANGASAFGSSGFYNVDNWVQTSVQTTEVLHRATGTNLTPGQWYQLEVAFDNGTVTGSVLAGSTVMVTYAASGLTHGASGGIAIFASGSRRFDTISLLNPGTPPSAVPEPQSWALFAASMGAMAALQRRRRKAGPT